MSCSTVSQIEAVRFDLSPSFRKASLKPEALNTILAIMVSSSGTEQQLQRKARGALERLVKETGNGKPILISGVEEFLTQLANVFDGELADGLGVLASMEAWGFGQSSFVETINFMNAMTRVVAPSGDRFLPKKARTIRLYRRIAHRLTSMARAFKWDPKKPEQNAIPLASTEQIHLTADLFDLWGLHVDMTYQNDMIPPTSIEDLWVLIWQVTHKRLSMGVLRKLSKKFDTLMFDNLLRLFARDEISLEAIKAIAKDPGSIAGKQTFKSVTDLSAAWTPVSRHISLRDFAALGGTREDYNCWIELQQEERDTALEAAQASHTLIMAEWNLTSGRKRTHRNYSGPTEAKVVDYDFHAIMSTLDIEVLFPDANVDVLKAILICAFFRDGSELLSPMRAPELNENKIWRGVRNYLPEGTGRRDVETHTDILIEARIIRSKGGRLVFNNDPSDRYPLALKVLEILTHLITDTIRDHQS